MHTLNTNSCWEPGTSIFSSAGIVLTKVTEVISTEKHKYLLIDMDMEKFTKQALHNTDHDIINLSGSSKTTDLTIHLIGAGSEIKSSISLQSKTGPS